MPISKLAAAANSVAQLDNKVRVVGNGNIETTLSSILTNEQAETLIICGSFYIMEEAFSVLGLRDSFLSENLTVKQP